jgi:uncharacterized phosphosugar-binding protein
MNFSYLGIVKGILDKIVEQQSEVLEKVSSLCADSIDKGHFLYFLGTGHSHMACEEPFYRAGGLVPIYPILEPSLMLHNGGSKSTLMERLDGMAEILLEDSGIQSGDILFLVSNSGRNSVVVEAALEARKRGITTVALTSINHSSQVESRHKSGKKLYEVTDYIIDNCGVPGDAVIQFKNFDQKVGPTSSIADLTVVNIIMINTVEKLLAKGITPPVFISSNLDGGEEFNRSFIDQYRQKIKFL